MTKKFILQDIYLFGLRLQYDFDNKRLTESFAHPGGQSWLITGEYKF